MWSGAGLDFGNKNCVVGIPKTHSIDVLLDQGSNRLIPTMVFYGDNRRFPGSFAQHEALQSLSQTITQLKRLVCLNYDSEERKIIEKLIYYDIVKLEDGFTGIKITNTETKEAKIYRPEQLIAFLFKSLLKAAQLVQPCISSLAVTVSPWWTEKQRRCIIDACKVGEIDLICLVNSTTAAAVGYVIDHRKRLPKTSEASVPVAFVDLGDSSLNVAVAMLNEESVVIKSFASDEHLGGSHFTSALLAYLVEQTKQKYNIDPTETSRMLYRFTEATEKLKKNLTVNTSVMFEVVGLKGDTDVKFLVKREEFEQQITNLIPRISKPIEEALAAANVKKEDLFAVEILGGGARVPAVKSELTKVFGREPETALNLDECFAVGCGYVAAILNPSMKVPIKVVDVTPHAISAHWVDADGTKICDLFKQFSEVPSTKRLPIRVKSSSQSTEVSLKINDDEICKVTFDTPKTEAEKDVIDVKIRVRLTQSSTIEVLDAAMVEKEGDKDKETSIKFNVEYKYGLSESQINTFIREEHKLTAADEYEEKIDDTRNELESYIYKSKGGIERDFPECFNEEETGKTKSLIQEIHGWFEEHEFERLPLKEYETRLKKLKDAAEPAITRANFYKTELKERADNIKTRISETLEAIEKNKKLKKDKKKEYLDKAKAYLNHFTEIVENAKKLKPHEDPPFSFKEEEGEATKILNEADQLLNDGENQKGGGWCSIA